MPVILQVPPVIGAAAPTGPVAVAVNERVEPREAVDELATTAITGVVWLTDVVEPDVGDVAK